MFTARERDRGRMRAFEGMNNAPCEDPWELLASPPHPVVRLQQGEKKKKELLKKERKKEKGEI